MLMKNRLWIRCFSLLFVLLLVFAASAFTAYAEDDDIVDDGNFDDGEDQPLTEEELAALARGYSVSLNEEDHHLLVIVHPTKLEEKPLDLSYAFQTAAEANAVVEISSRKISFLFDREAVKEIAASSEVPTLFVLGPVLYTTPETTDETTGEETEEDPLYSLPDGLYDGDSYCIIRFTGAKLKKGTVKLTITYRPTNADLVRVLVVRDDGNEALDAKCKDREIKFKTDELCSLIITEREPVKGESMVKLLTLVLAFVLLSSAVLAVLMIRKGRAAKAEASGKECA